MGPYGEKLALGSHVFEDNLHRQTGAGYIVEALECQANALYGQLKETVFPIHLNLPQTHATQQI